GLDGAVEPTILKSRLAVLPLTEVTVALMRRLAPLLRLPVQVSAAPTVAFRSLGQLTLTILIPCAANFWLSTVFASDATPDALTLIMPAVLKSRCALLPLTEVMVALIRRLAPVLKLALQVSAAPTVALRSLAQLRLTRLIPCAANCGSRAVFALDATSDALILLDPHATIPALATRA